MILADGVLSGRNATLFIMVITTVLLLAFCMMALRLRKYIIGTIGEAASGIISKFVIPPDIGGSSASISSSGSGGGGGGSGGSGGGLVSGVTSVAGGLTGSGGNGIGGKVLGAAGVAGAAGVVGSLASKSEGHQAVGTGDGSSVIGQNSSVANDNSTQTGMSSANSTESSSQSDVAGTNAQESGVIANANNQNSVMTGNGIATSADVMNGSMRADSYRDASDKAAGAELMQADSLASVSANPNVSTSADMVGSNATMSDKSVAAGEAYTGDVSAYGNNGMAGSATATADGADMNVKNAQQMNADEMHADRLVAGSEPGTAYAEGGEAGMNGQAGLRGVGADGDSALVEGAANNGIYENGPGSPYHAYESEYERGAQAGEVNASMEAQQDASMSGYATAYVNGEAGGKTLGQTARNVQAGGQYGADGQNGYAYASGGQAGMITADTDVHAMNGADGAVGYGKVMNGRVSANVNANNGLRGVSVPVGANAPGSTMSGSYAGMQGAAGQNGTSGRSGSAANGSDGVDGVRGVSLGQAAVGAKGEAGSAASGVAGANGANGVGSISRGVAGQNGQGAGMYRNSTSSSSSSQSQNSPVRVPAGMNSQVGSTGSYGSGSYRSMGAAAAGAAGAPGSAGAAGRNGSGTVNANVTGSYAGYNRNMSSTGSGNASANVSVVGSRGGSGFESRSGSGQGGSATAIAAGGNSRPAPTSVVGSYANRSSGNRQGRPGQRSSERGRSMAGSAVGSGVTPESRGSATHGVGGSGKMSLGAAAQAVRGGEFGSDRMRQSGAYRRQSQNNPGGSI